MVAFECAGFGERELRHDRGRTGLGGQAAPGAFAAEALGKMGTGDSMKILRKRYEIETHPLVISKIESIVLY